MPYTRLFNGAIRVDRPSLTNVARIDLGCMPLIQRMNLNGLYLNPDKLTALDRDLAWKEDENLAELAFMIGRDLNPNSGDQVAALLFDELKLEPPGGLRLVKSQKRATTDDNVLAALDSTHPVVPLIRRGREIHKLRTTYVGPLPSHRHKDGRVRTTLKMTTARTGRLASENPNLQNIPVRTKEGQRIRAAFEAHYGVLDPSRRIPTKLVSIDLSQIEMVWAAELSGDETMRQVFRLGQDLHVKTACSLFRLDYSRISGLWALYKKGQLPEGSPEYLEMRDFEINKRLPAKTLGFSILYGVTAKGLQINILAAGGPFWTEEECEKFIRLWFEVFPGVADWMALQFSRVRLNGLVWNDFGRTRIIPGVHSQIQSIVNEALRQSGNAPIQGSAGDHLKLAMGEIYAAILPYYWSFPSVICDPCLQIHDELIFEVSTDVVDDFAAEAKYCMEHAIELSMPTKASVSIGDHWGELK